MINNAHTYTDYLGSILAITDNVGALEETHSFDAWGRRRNPLNWEYIPAFDDDFTSTITDRGYTGHEHLDAFGLINMNGRLYDPVLGRMLSPDNFIQSPGSPMGMNRYMYANNNPLRFTDPSGNATWDQWFAVITSPFSLAYYLVAKGNQKSNDEAFETATQHYFFYKGSAPWNGGGSNETPPDAPSGGNGNINNYNNAIAQANQQQVDQTPLSLYDMSLMASNEAGGGFDNYSLNYNEPGYGWQIPNDKLVDVEFVDMQSGNVGYSGYAKFSSNPVNDWENSLNVPINNIFIDPITYKQYVYIPARAVTIGRTGQLILNKQIGYFANTNYVYYRAYYTNSYNARVYTWGIIPRYYNNEPFYPDTRNNPY